MAFGVNYDEAGSENSTLPEGEYEVIIKYAGEDVTARAKTAYINVTCVIRNDVDQQYKNKYIWHSIWQKKEKSPADLACGGYSSKQIQSLSKAAGLENGKKYESLADWCDDLKNHVIRVTTENEEYPAGSGKIQTRVKWTNESKFPQCNHRWKNADVDVVEDEAPAPKYAAPAQQGFEEVPSDDDLPF